MMPSTRRQKAKDNQLGQSDVVSDVENMDARSFSGNEYDNHSTQRELEVDSPSVRGTK